jgi:hypothetical protein
MSSILEKITPAQEGFKSFSSNKYLQGSQEFLYSNSIVAKFAFLILALFVFIALLRLGTSIISWLFSAKQNPILLNGMIDSTRALTIFQDPSISGSIPILRSSNQNDGLEFTWSVWAFINSSNYTTPIADKYFCIFNKGIANSGIANSDSIGLSNGPGLYISKNTNNLIVAMDTFNSSASTTPANITTISNIPLDKWINIVIRVSKQRQLDVYINGVLKNRNILDSVVRQNYDNVLLSPSGSGFVGYTSLLRYFNTAIGTNDIQSIVEEGPNQKFAIPSQSINNNKGSNQFISSSWYFPK